MMEFAVGDRVRVSAPDPSNEYGYRRFSGLDREGVVTHVYEGEDGADVLLDGDDLDWAYAFRELERIP